MSVSVREPTAEAAFFRVEGVLVQRPAIATAAYLAANAQGLSERLARLGGLAIAAPFALAAGPLGVGSTASRATWMGLRGMGEDRVTVLAQEYYEKHMEPSVLDLGRDLVQRAKKRGQRIVLISDNIDLVIRPLAEELGADDLVVNRLELKRGEVTGRLAEPVVGQLGGAWLRAFAAEHGVDVQRSAAYGANAADGLLLSAIGLPCAVSPDVLLRRTASEQGWPVVDA